MHIPVTQVPSDVDYVIVSDMFAEDYQGGAELTLEAILESCPGSFYKIRSQALTTDAIDSAKDKHWILGNYVGVSKNVLIHLATSGVKYSVIECDYKYCIFRSSHLHKLKTGKGCDCNLQEHGRFTKGFFKRAHKVFFMSEGQLNEYKRLFPVMNNWGNKLIVQGSTFKSDTLEYMMTVFHKTKTVPRQWAVLSGGTWIKNQQATENYCKRKGYDYKLIGGLPHREFLKELSRCKGLVFHPAGFDTNPRIIIEAKCLGLQLDLNENVQQKDEEWFTREHPHDIIKHLEELPEKFWKDLNNGA